MKTVTAATVAFVVAGSAVSISRAECIAWVSAMGSMALIAHQPADQPAKVVVRMNDGPAPATIHEPTVRFSMPGPLPNAGTSLEVVNVTPSTTLAGAIVVPDNTMPRPGDRIDDSWESMDRSFDGEPGWGQPFLLTGMGGRVYGVPIANSRHSGRWSHSGMGRGRDAGDSLPINTDLHRAAELQFGAASASPIPPSEEGFRRATLQFGQAAQTPMNGVQGDGLRHETTGAAPTGRHRRR